jgi:phosphoribosylformylglycinamidine synthase
MILENLKTLLQVPDIASKKWIYEQYDSQVMNDTIYARGDAAIVRVHGTNKALAMTTDCTPRYVEADPFEGAKQAVAETYRNISAVGGKPLAITNCLNFGNPQKPEVMGQIVRAIQGITDACKGLDYPVVSGNVSLYNETDGKAIQPTPAIGGVGLFKNSSKRCDLSFKRAGDEIFVIGKTLGHISVSLFEREILKKENIV